MFLRDVVTHVKIRAADSTGVFLAKRKKKNPRKANQTLQGNNCERYVGRRLEF